MINYIKESKKGGKLMDIRSTMQGFFEQYWLSIPWQMILSEILSKLISLVILSILFILGKKSFT